jgi:hypothetical protein
MEGVLDVAPEISRFSVAEFRRDIAADAQARLRSLLAGESRTWVEIDDVVVFRRPHREILHRAETGSVTRHVVRVCQRGGDRASAGRGGFVGANRCRDSRNAKSALS